jgi:hypothetical protein
MLSNITAYVTFVAAGVDQCCGHAALRAARRHLSHNNGIWRIMTANAPTRRELLLQAELLMEQALQLLDQAGEDHAGALLDHAITTLPGRLQVISEDFSSGSRPSESKRLGTND